MNEGLDRDQRGSGEKNVVRITAEDLGMVNGGFNMADEDPLTPMSSEARSEMTQKIKRVEAPSLLSVQPQVQLVTTHTIKEEEKDLQLLSDEGSDNIPGSGVLLMTPEINLIPPTPSNVNDGNQFFCSNSGEIVTHACGEGRPAAGDEEEKIKNAEESSTGCAPAEVLTAEAEGEPEHVDGRSRELAEQNETEPLEKWDKEKFKHKVSWRSRQMAPVCFGKKKSEYLFCLTKK